MKYQTNPELGPFVNNWGCNIHSVLEKVEKTSARFGRPFKFSNNDVSAVYVSAMRHGIIGPEVKSEDGAPVDGCVVNNGKALFNLCAVMYSLPVRCDDMRTESASYTPISGEEEILELKRAGYSGSHFVAGNGVPSKSLANEIEFDPIEGGSQCAKKGWIASKRIYKISRREV